MHKQQSTTMTRKHKKIHTLSRNERQ